MPEPQDDKHRDALDKRLEAINESARVGRTVHLTFLLLAVYFAISIGSTTHEMLLRQSDIAVPFLNVGFPVHWFYAVMPIVWILLHFNLLLLLYTLSGKIHDLRDWSSEIDWDPEDMERVLRTLLHPFPTVQWLTRAHPSSLVRFLFRAYVTVTMLLLPTAILLAAQIRFLPYHNEWITVFSHWFMILIDLGLIAYFWPRISRGKGRKKYWARHPLFWFVAGPAALFSLVVVSVPEGWVDRNIIFTRYAKKSPANLKKAPKKETTFRDELLTRNLSVSRTLLVKEPPPSELIAAYMARQQDEEDILRDHSKGMDLSGRNLRNADLSEARLYHANLIGADLQGANLKKAHLQSAKLWDADLKGAKLFQANLEGANLRGADMRGADLRFVRMEGAFLKAVRLEKTNLHRAHLEGADLKLARLEGANLKLSFLRGANFEEAHLEGSNLSKSNAEAATFKGARLEGADLRKANVIGASFINVHMEGADLRRAILKGVFFINVHLEGARFSGAYLQGSEFLTVTDSAHPQLALVDFRDTSWQPLLITKIEKIKTEMGEEFEKIVALLNRGAAPSTQTMINVRNFKGAKERFNTAMEKGGPPKFDHRERMDSALFDGLFVNQVMKPQGMTIPEPPIEEEKYRADLAGRFCLNPYTGRQIGLRALHAFKDKEMAADILEKARACPLKRGKYPAFVYERRATLLKSLRKFVGSGKKRSPSIPPGGQVP